ncbi:MAG: helix-turn-helix domain-containing protein [Synergistaceae bacterium]|nr:helix-turn-helix domain-containing protein [Synergistaceae bacterium]
MLSEHRDEKELIKFHGRIGERIKKVREARLCSQKQLSRRSGLSQSQLSRIEAGERAASLFSLSRIADALRVSPGYLMKYSGESRVASGE